jgi:hypothetical protein
VNITKTGSTWVNIRDGYTVTVTPASDKLFYRVYSILVLLVLLLSNGIPNDCFFINSLIFIVFSSKAVSQLGWLKVKCLIVVNMDFKYFTGASEIF